MAARRQYLIECRQAKGSRKQVASDLCISVIYLRMIENGTHKPGRDVMIRISKYMGQPLEALFPDLFGGNQVI